MQRMPAGWGSAPPSISNQAMLRSERAADGVAEQALNSGQGVEKFFESRFGLRASGVGIHTGEDAAASARSLGAKAFTQGRDIYFGAGQYAPGNRQGQRLLAHELTHVVQQESGAAPSGAIQRDGLTEKEALTNPAATQELPELIRDVLGDEAEEKLKDWLGGFDVTPGPEGAGNKQDWLGSFKVTPNEPPGPLTDVEPLKDALGNPVADDAAADASVLEGEEAVAFPFFLMFTDFDHYTPPKKSPPPKPFVYHSSYDPSAGAEGAGQSGRPGIPNPLLTAAPPESAVMPDLEPPDPSKTSARTDSGLITTSGWGPLSVIPGYGGSPSPDVWRHYQETGVNLPPHLFDYADAPGSYYASHAEPQALFLDPSATFLEVTRPVCPQCSNLLRFSATERGMTIVVLDPNGFRYYLPNGTIVSGESGTK